MGCDKAALAAPPYRSLLDRQLALLAALGVCERIVSLRTGQMIPSGVRASGIIETLDDGVAGPLGGLVATLRVARAPRVFLMGVDVANFDMRMAQRVIGAAPEGTGDVGIVPRTTGAVQSLAALWPRAILPLAEAQLAQGGDLSLRTLVAQGIAAGCLRWFEVASWDAPRFANLNCRSDFLAYRASPPDRFVT
jgi:molybdopterin-guanine dinucleotide biosynthesis protein A